MEAKQFEETLSTQDGFKAIFGGLLGGFRAKASFEIYSAAQKKGVYDIEVLRRKTYEGNHYAIMAFSPKGRIDKETLQIITERANTVPLGTIRYECIGYSKLEGYRGNGHESFAAENKEITSIADDWEDIFVFPVSDSEKNLDCPFIIYANKDGKDYVFPVPRNRLK